MITQARWKQFRVGLAKIVTSVAGASTVGSTHGKFSFSKMHWFRWACYIPANCKKTNTCLCQSISEYCSPPTPSQNWQWFETHTKPMQMNIMMIILPIIVWQRMSPNPTVDIVTCKQNVKMTRKQL